MGAAASLLSSKGAAAAYAAAAQAPAGSLHGKARATAQSFESTFLQSTLETLFQGLGEDGPLGTGNVGGGAWRGFLVEEYAKGLSRTSTFGIAPQVYREILRIQEGATTGPR